MAPVGTPRPADLVHLKPSNGAGMLALAGTAAGTVAGVALAARGEWLPWITGQLILAVAFVQWFVILHECGHDTLFRTRTWNRVAGSVAGFCTDSFRVLDARARPPPQMDRLAGSRSDD